MVLKVAIQDLPAETLLMVFEHLFWMSCAEVTCSCADECFCRKDNVEMAWTPDEDLLVSSIFPYATSLVCKRWRTLMRSDCRFWTRIVILLDKDPTPLLKMQSQIDLSGNLPLDIHVLRRWKTRDPEEHILSKPIIQLLHQYLYRCRVIAFDLTHNSSLPSISRDLRREAPHLVKLQLRCQMDDGKEYIWKPPFEGGSDEDFSSFSSLQILDIDGKNFADCCMDGSYWEDNLSDSIKHVVTISNYLPVSNAVSEQCTMWDFVTGLVSIPCISKLRLANLQFHDDPISEDDIFTLDISMIEFKDLDLKFICLFFQYVVFIRPYRLHIIQCPLPTFSYFLNPAYHLKLERVTIGDNPFHLFLEEWEGRTLELVDLPIFDDSAILSLIKNTTPEDPQIPQRRDFLITDCTNFSVAALKQLIASRNAALQQFYPTPAPRCLLHVSGRSPMLPLEDREWFSNNLDLFCWEKN